MNRKDVTYLAGMLAMLALIMVGLYFALTLALAAIDESERCARKGGVLIGHTKCIQKVEGF